MCRDSCPTPSASKLTLRLDSATCESAHVHGPPEGLSNRGARETDPNVGMMAAVVGPAHQNLAVFVALCSHARGNHRETSGRRGEGNIDVLYLHVMIVFVLLLASSLWRKGARMGGVAIIKCICCGDT